ncbi:porin [Crenobacter luteus]|uniref:Porin n=1 Tax=Crenobacter luteus TaxID=1452487 RepID=A0A165EX54_9NEIS|nr:porin [Crenobacter luteus]KZE28631.1 porin [Crenobacter luteus]
MKLKYVLLVLLGASAAASADVKIIGKIEGGLQVKRNVDGTRVNGVKDFGSEIDFVGSEDLGDGLKAIWQMNNNVHIDNAQAGDVFASGDTFVGLSGGFGAVKLGRGINAYGDNYWGGGFYDVGDHGADRGVGGVLGMGDAGGQKGAVKYESPKFGAFNASASWAAGEKGGDGHKAGNAWALGAYYEGVSYGLHAGYTRQDLVTGSAGAYSDAGSARDWVLAGKWSPFDGLTVGAEYNHATLSSGAATIGALAVPDELKPQKSLALRAEYRPGRFAVRATVLRTENYKYDDEQRRNEVVLGSSYELSKRTALVAEYLRSKVNTDPRAGSELVLGLHTHF